MTAGLLVSLAGLLLWQAPAPSTVNRPSFAGTWQMDASRSESAAESDGNPVLLEIAQSDREISIATSQGTRRSQASYVFTAGPPAPYGVDGSAGRASWNGQALITEGTRLVQGQTVATRETRTLSPDGAEMIVEVVVIVQHGYQIRGGRNYGIGKDIYKRVAR